MSDELIGESIGRRYRILETIGTGGLGTVYKALDTRLQRFVALKILHSATDPESRDRLLQERRALNDLNDAANIVRIFDWGETDGHAYLVLDYIEGTSLEQIIAKGRPIAAADAIRIVRQVGIALAHIHRRGLIHRDVKPSNILISKEGRVFLSDLGLAIAFAAQRPATVAGTPRYMSPEQAMGKPLDARSDLFSLGVVLYESLTGTLPFDADATVVESFQKIVEEPPIPPRRVNPNLNRSLEEVVLRALAKEPAHRFQSAPEFVAALENIEPTKAGDHDTDLPAESGDSHRFPDSFQRVRVREAEGALLESAREPSAHSSRIALSGRSGPPRRSVSSSRVGTITLLVVGLALLGILLGSGGIPFSESFLVLSAAVLALGFLWLLWRFYERHSETEEASPAFQSLGLDRIVTEASHQNVSAPKGDHPGLRRRQLAGLEEANITQAGLEPYVPPPATGTRTLTTDPSGIAWLLILDGDLHGREFRLADNVTIGRGHGNDIVLADDRISRAHARISLENSRYYIVDLGSRFGTLVNGQRVSRQELRDRDQLTVATTELLFIQAASPADLDVETKRRLREFETIWDELVKSTRHG